MWLFTPDGFVSVVQHRDDPEMLMVRARKREHLEVLDFDFEIVETPRGDYRFRTTVPRNTWAQHLVQVAMSMDYTNVKGATPTGPYKDSMMEVWSAMHRLQVGRPRTGPWRAELSEGDQMAFDMGDDF